MRRILTLSVLCLAASVVNACRPDEIIETTAIPTAGVRFIHAVPDTGRLDFRFVDFAENNVQWQIEYRNTPRLSPTGANGVPGATFVTYKAARAGGEGCASATSCDRRFRIFLNGTTAAVASTVLKDTTVTLEAGKNYTALLWGYADPANGPAMELRFIEEAVADPGAQVAVRVINATSGPLDVYFYADGSAAPVAPSWPGVAAMTVETHQQTAPGIIWYQVRDQGSAVDAFADRRALRGVAALVGIDPVTGEAGPLDAIPGTEVAGSAVTGIVFPASVAGTAAPQGGGSSTIPAWNVRAIVFVWDRRPPRPSGI